VKIIEAWDKCSPQSRVRYFSIITSSLSWAEAKFQLRLDWHSVKMARQVAVPLADLIDFSLELGFRISETCRVTWKDLDRKKKMLWVRDRKHPKDKIGNDYHIPLLGKSLEIIERQPTEGLPDGRIFPFKPDPWDPHFAVLRRSQASSGYTSMTSDMRL
jgi:integrase